jgi:hypothetical protein
MRRLSVFNSISLDGFIADAGGDMSWARKPAVPETGRLQGVQERERPPELRRLALKGRGRPPGRCA